MSSRASAKSPTPGSSSSSRNQPQSLAQEPANTEDFDMPDLKYDSDGDGSFTKESYDKLRRIIQKQEAETKDMQKIVNENRQAIENLNEQLQHAGQAYKKLEEDIKGDANLRKIQELQGEITTLRAAANIVTTPVHGGRQKLKLSAPVTYDGTPGTLKGFLIQYTQPPTSEERPSSGLNQSRKNTSNARPSTSTLPRPATSTPILKDSRIRSGHSSKTPTKSDKPNEI
nr:reverse transcriptase domain protein [Colletotrichum truncatum]KAF6781221.1 reverse transcriptase domain protein [Colletotrichum truncatum]